MTTLDNRTSPADGRPPVSASYHLVPGAVVGDGATAQPATVASAPGPRSMASYLLLPRPGDLGKAIILPVGFAVGSLLTQAPSAHSIFRALIVWFALEYLVYQARYQWNDIRGFWSDQLHPDCDARGRLPGPVEQGQAHIRVSARFAAARVLAAVVLVSVVARFEIVPIASLVAVFAVAAVYEKVRSHAGGCGPAARPPLACVVLWMVSGGGYCVRGLTGLLLATGTHASSTGLVLTGVACWSAGIVFVTTRWAVESIPFMTRVGGRLEWVASPDAGRGHLLALACWLPRDADTAPDDVRHWRMLWVRRPWHAPWNIALLAALVSAWLGGVAFTATTATGIAAPALSGAVVAAAWTMLMLRPCAVTGVMAVIVLVAAAIAECGTPAPAALSVVVCVVYITGTHQSLSDVGTFYQRRIAPAFRAVPIRSASVLPTPAGTVHTARSDRGHDA